MFQYVPKHCMATPKNKNKHMHWQLLYCCSCFIRECARRRQRRACAACADCSAGCTVPCMLTLVLVLTPTRRQQHSHALGEQQKRAEERENKSWAGTMASGSLDIWLSRKPDMRKWGGERGKSEVERMWCNAGVRGGIDRQARRFKCRLRNLNAGIYLYK